MYQGKIVRVYPNSLAEELELVAGDKIIEINGQKLRDIIDLSFAFADEEIEMLVEHEDGEQEMISFDKDCDEELGVEFASAVFDGIRKCANNCCFCFVNMIAPNMRESLSVKDDDYRMSFLYGNFITMTNMGEADFRRIEQFHLSPLYVSIHAMNPELRAEILRCRKAADISAQLDRLQQAGAEYHTQVVLCAGLNDGSELDRTILEIMQRRPYVLSMAVVPVGMTKYRTDAYPLKQFDKESAAKVIQQAEAWQEKFRRETGKTMLYLGDEFYLLAGKEIPPAEFYDGFPQLDNGIGLTRSFLCDWQEVDLELDSYAEDVYLDVIAGTSIAPILERLTGEAMQQSEHLHVRVLPVVNRTFGESINVSGLLTGKDIVAALKALSGRRDGILIPESALRAGEDIFLDDYTLQDLRKEFAGVRVEPVRSGRDFHCALLDWQNYSKKRQEDAAYTWQGNAGYTKQGD